MENVVKVSKKIITSRTRNIERIDCNAYVGCVADEEKIGPIRLSFYGTSDDFIEVRMSLESALDMASDLLKQATIERRNEFRRETPHA